MQTRSKKILTDEPKDENLIFKLHEKPGSIIRDNDHDFQYYLVPNTDSNIYKNLSKHYKMEAYSQNFKELTIINTKKAFINVPTFIQMEIHETNFKESIQAIKTHCQANNYRNIATSFEMTKYKDIFKIKTIISDTFKILHTNITIYLNKINNITSEEEKKEILKEYHDSPLAGHRGINHTISKIKHIYLWENMIRDITNYAQSCETCQKIKFLGLIKSL